MWPRGPLLPLGNDRPSFTGSIKILSSFQRKFLLFSIHPQNREVPEAMESTQKLELIDQAIKKILAEKKITQEASAHSFKGEDNDHLVLNRLLSELEAVKGGSVLKESEEEANSGSVGLGSENVGQAGEGSNTEEILKELKHVKKQNLVTHCLLSALILVTIAWQVSEVSLILKLKDGFSHPFKSFGSLLAGMIKRPAPHGENGEKHEHAEESSVHLPELPHMPDLGLNGKRK